MGRDKYDGNLRLLECAGGGTHGQSAGSERKPLPGGGSWRHGPSRVSFTDIRLRPYLGELEQGGVVIDKRRLVSHPMFASWVIGDPMVDVELEPGETSRFSDQQTMATMLPGLCGQYAMLALLSRNSEYTGLDYVDVGHYAALWSSRGARVGVREGDAIIWNDGAREAIPPAADRYKCPDCQKPVIGDECCGRAF